MRFYPVGGDDRRLQALAGNGGRAAFAVDVRDMEPAEIREYQTSGSP